jgi:hypothetical protein
MNKSADDFIAKCCLNCVEVAFVAILKLVQKDSKKA